ncbi:PIN domain protein [Thioploca ingrica]|uniref:PIN domain protein n=1 Tax=Thioploca ingrica TaxID=40754 RepID=A0A090AH06_9GAMM|nr:PIN domain protein [Thioploca ingrica]
MKQQTIYLDTSVIGGCFDEEFAPWSKGLIKDLQLGHFKAVVSELVAAEIQNAPLPVRQQLATILELDHEYLMVTEVATTLADVYQQRHILTPKYYDDGLHIALATVAQVDLLVSWNFKHIVHFDKIRLFKIVNLEQGYKTLLIYSPREVTHYEEF